MLSSTLRDALADYRSRLEREWPGRIRRVVLFGSYARGEAHEDSDVDVLVVIDRATFAERARAIDLGALVGLDFRLVIAPLVQTEAEWAELERRERLLPQEIARDGIEA